MTANRPLCVVCGAEEREPRSSRCWACGPGRITTPEEGTPVNDDTDGWRWDNRR